MIVAVTTGRWRPSSAPVDLAIALERGQQPVGAVCTSDGDRCRLQHEPARSYEVERLPLRRVLLLVTMQRAGRIDPLGELALRAGDAAEAGALDAVLCERQQAVTDEQIHRRVRCPRGAAHEIEYASAAVVVAVPRDETEHIAVLVNCDAAVRAQHGLRIEASEREAHLATALCLQPVSRDRGGAVGVPRTVRLDGDAGTAGRRDAVAGARSLLSRG